MIYNQENRIKEGTEELVNVHPTSGNWLSKVKWLEKWGAKYFKQLVWVILSHAWHLLGNLNSKKWAMCTNFFPPTSYHTQTRETILSGCNGLVSGISKSSTIAQETLTENQAGPLREVPRTWQHAWGVSLVERWSHEISSRDMVHPACDTVSFQ